ncbi:MAG: cytochrome c maturation protein CcmE [Gammaproteobacteria bacterium]|nr:cytochrome c maturation protein CcmE [Gammaproteobacteria bacterium]
MKPHRRNRLALVALIVLSAGGAVSLATMALNENLNLFYAPIDIVEGRAPTDTRIRAGGMVVDGSVKRSKTDLSVEFAISDMQSAQVPIRYTGILPDLFREGQGIVAHGKLDEHGVFIADEVLAKHDENYMPPEVADAIADAHETAETNKGTL